MKNTKQKHSDLVYLAGMTCFKCGKAPYEGYEGAWTLPCKVCGDVRPAIMTDQDFWHLMSDREEDIRDRGIPRG